MTPGERILSSQPIALHPVGSTTSLEVTNTDSREIWVGSHYPFFEVNRALRFARIAAWGRRLAIPAGDCMRFAPGETITVELADIGGRRRVLGFNGLSAGETTPDRLEEALGRMRDAGFQDSPELP